MRRVLIIAYFFPPDGGAGTQRAAKFCKYLGHFGWRPWVLTRQTETDAVAWNPADPSLSAEIGTETRITRIAGAAAPVAWARTLPHIDIARGWLEPAAEAALEIIRREDIEAVWITMSPFDLCFLGRQIERVTRIPVIYDLRDPWALDGVRVYGTRARWRRDYGAMVATLGAAAGVIANTSEAARALRASVPGLPMDRVAIIPNGYDAADFEGPAPAFDAGDGTFRLVHTGTFLSSSLYAYEGWLGPLKRLRHYRAEPLDPSGRTPQYLLRAVRLLKERGHPLGRVLRMVFVGREDHATQRCVRESGVADLVQMAGYAPHLESVRQVRAADALFLHLHGLPLGRRSLIVPGKTYEYLASGRPILGCVPDGDARDLLQRSGRGFCANPCDPEDIARVLAELYVAWREHRWQKPVDQTWLLAFERRELTRRLAAVLNRAVDRHSCVERYQKPSTLAYRITP